MQASLSVLLSVETFCSRLNQILMAYFYLIYIFSSWIVLGLAILRLFVLHCSQFVKLSDNYSETSASRILFFPFFILEMKEMRQKSLDYSSVIAMPKLILFLAVK